MIGQHAPIRDGHAFGEILARFRLRLGELERTIASRQAFVGAVTTATTNASGQITVTHGLGFTPSGVVATPASVNASQVRVDSITASSFRVTVWSAAGTAVNAASVTVQWIAFS